MNTNDIENTDDEDAQRLKSTIGKWAAAAAVCIPLYYVLQLNRDIHWILFAAAGALFGFIRARE